MGCQGKLIDLINSPLHLSPFPGSPGAHPLLSRARVPLGRRVCFGPISITHLAEQRRRGASGRQAVINCLFALLLSPRWRMQGSSRLGLGGLTAGRWVSLLSGLCCPLWIHAQAIWEGTMAEERRLLSSVIHIQMESRKTVRRSYVQGSKGVCCVC